MMAVKNTQRYRSKGRIMVDILRAIRQDGEAKITHILYRANLSYDRLIKYLDQLQESGFIEKIDIGDRIFFKITPKGDRFISEFRKIEEFAEAFGIDI